MIIRKVETVEVNYDVNKYDVLRLSTNWLYKKNVLATYEHNKTFKYSA